MSSTERRVIATSNAPAAIGPYSQAILEDGWLWCSGQIALDPATGELAQDDVATETARVLDNLGAVLSEAGVDFSAIVKTTIYLTDMADFGVVNEVYGARFGDKPPARATVQVAGLPKGARVEIDCVARVRS